MAQVEARRLEIDSVIPHFSLPAVGGGQVNSRDFKQRLNLLIAYMDLDRCDSCGDFLRGLSDNLTTYRGLETQVLVICPQPLSNLRERLIGQGLPFPILSDENREVGRTYLDEQEEGEVVAEIFITDRFGALRYQQAVHAEAPMPDQRNIVDWLTLVESECPECGAAEANWRG